MLILALFLLHGLEVSGQLVALGIKLVQVVTIHHDRLVSLLELCLH